MVGKRTGRENALGLLVILVLFLAADTILFLIAGMPRIEDAVEQKRWEGLNLIEKYHENSDMIGWVQVEGTNINYPVMRGDIYIYRNFSGEYSASGSLFVEEDWSEEDVCTLVYGHNMWMYGTMFNPLHRFAEPDFFRRNRVIKFYTIEEDGESAEKRTYEILFCIRTRVDEWSYAGCRYMCTSEELAAFAEECRNRAIQTWETGKDEEGECGELIVLSTCSYHVRGGKGRLLLVGELTGRTEQTRIDVNQR